MFGYEPHDSHGCIGYEFVSTTFVDDLIEFGCVVFVKPDGSNLFRRLNMPCKGFVDVTNG